MKGKDLRHYYDGVSLLQFQVLVVQKINALEFPGDLAIAQNLDKPRIHKAGVFRRHDGLAQFHAFLPCHHRVAHWPLHKYDRALLLLLPGLHGRLHRLFLAGYVGLPGFQLRFFLADTTRAGQDRKQYAKNARAHGQQLVCASRSTSMQCGTAAATKPKHSTAPLGLPGRQITSDLSTTAARLRDKIAL